MLLLEHLLWQQSLTEIFTLNVSIYYLLLLQQYELLQQHVLSQQRIAANIAILNVPELIGKSKILVVPFSTSKKNDKSKDGFENVSLIKLLLALLTVSI